MSTELSVYHQRSLEAARRRVTEMAELKVTDMTEAELFMWLTRMEVAARGLLHIVNLLAIAGDLEEARDAH